MLFLIKLKMVLVFVVFQVTPVVDESGSYSCRAGNVFGEKAAHITVLEAGLFFTE